jgi:hypothetical protein
MSDFRQFKLRIPGALAVLIETKAVENQRSINAEIVHRLLVSLEGDHTAARLERIEAMLSEARATHVNVGGVMLPLSNSRANGATASIPTSSAVPASDAPSREAA